MRFCIRFVVIRTSSMNKTKKYVKSAIFEFFDPLIASLCLNCQRFAENNQILIIYENIIKKSFSLLILLHEDIIYFECKRILNFERKRERYSPFLHTCTFLFEEICKNFTCDNGI